MTTELPTDAELAHDSADRFELLELGYHFRPIISDDDRERLRRMFNLLRTVDTGDTRVVIRIERGAIAMGAPAWCLVSYIDAPYASTAMVALLDVLANALLDAVSDN